MKVVFFKEHSDYRDFALSLSPTLSSAAGFWDPDRNVSFFFHYASDETFRTLQSIADQLEADKKQAIRKKQADFVRFANAINGLVDIWQEEQDIGLISHEATHQIAGSTGLLPRKVRVPFWIHEGLAMYFETPKGASWSGIGSVNEERLRHYRRLADDAKLSSLDFIIGDELFNHARASRDHELLLAAYGQGWALTHFLLEQHFHEFIEYYRLLGKMPRELMLSPDTLRTLFDRCFKTSRKQLELEWKAFMRGQKTDFERAVANATRG